MSDKKDFNLRELHETIRGGERVLIRRVQPEDMALYPDFLRAVSAEDLRLRFFSRIAELSAEEIDKLTHLDYRHEMAFIALDEDTGQMLGLVRLKDELDERTAEFAILVRSRLKGHGLGWPLMRRVIDYAKEKRLRRMYGDVLVENAIMLQMCAELGFQSEYMGIGHQARCARSRKHRRPVNVSLVAAVGKPSQLLRYSPKTSAGSGRIGVLPD
jgi:RimJ/RimL family protein N-acetyltransferase